MSVKNLLKEMFYKDNAGAGIRTQELTKRQDFLFHLESKLKSNLSPAPLTRLGFRDPTFRLPLQSLTLHL